jgi:Rad3-related DNA helicase
MHFLLRKHANEHSARRTTTATAHESDGEQFLQRQFLQRLQALHKLSRDSTAPQRATQIKQRRNALCKLSSAVTRHVN